MHPHCVSGDDILIVPGAINAVLDGFVILLVSRAANIELLEADLKYLASSSFMAPSNYF